MNEIQKKRVIDRIREAIARSGQYVCVVSGGETPRFAYTIGVSESVGVELILAGAVFYIKDEVLKIINNVAAQLKAERDCDVFRVDRLDFPHHTPLGPSLLPAPTPFTVTR